MQRKTITYTRYRPTARVLSTGLIASIRVVVVGIESRMRNDATGPECTRIQLIRISTRGALSKSGNGNDARRGHAKA